MERLLAKTFNLRVFLYLIIYNFHFTLYDIELTTILASVYTLLIVSNRFYFEKRVLFFYLLISIICLLCGYVQLIPHAIFGAEIGTRIIKFRNNYKLIKIILLFFSVSNFFIFVNDISKFSSFIGFSQLTVFSHIQALVLCLLFSNEFLIKHKKIIYIYLISSLLMPVRTLIFLLFFLIVINRFKFVFNNISRFFYVSLVLLIVSFKLILSSGILPSSGDSVKFRLAILNQVLSVPDFEANDEKLKDDIWKSSGINLDYVDVLSLDNTLLTIQSKSYFAFVILVLIILYCKAEIVFLFLILDDYTNGLQFLFLFAIIVSFYNLNNLNYINNIKK
jgi:hypothetical protein